MYPVMARGNRCADIVFDEQDRKKIEKIVKKLSVIGKYSLKKDSQIIDVTAKINLSNIWK